MDEGPTLDCTKHLNNVEYWIGGQQYTIHQENNSLDHGTTLWDASKVLGLYLYQLKKKSSKNKLECVLELGAGCGLAGFVSSVLGMATIITDQPHITGILKYNAKLNKHLFPNLQADNLTTLINRNQEFNLPTDAINNPLVIIDRLLWGDKEDIERYNKLSQKYNFNYILAADCIYDIKVLELFLNTLNSIVHNSSTTILVALEPRDPFVVEQFVIRSKQFDFAVTKIPRSKLPKPYNDPTAPCDIYKLKRK